MREYKFFFIDQKRLSARLVLRIKEEIEYYIKNFDINTHPNFDKTKIISINEDYGYVDLLYMCQVQNKLKEYKELHDKTVMLLDKDESLLIEYVKHEMKKLGLKYVKHYKK